jgi:Fic family protein
VAESKEYETSHPWLSFRLDAASLPPPVWILLGEAVSKCEHLTGVPLQPKTAHKLTQDFLIKGARASGAIEGNNLSEAQIKQQLSGTLQLPPSKKYLAQEVQNLIDAFNGLGKELVGGLPVDLTVDRICAYNTQVLRNLDTLVHPGVIRMHTAGAMAYRGAPSEDCRYLMQRLVDWLNAPSFLPEVESPFIKTILAAILAHLYLAWIRPFEDGNGRTARLVEFGILVAGGVPLPAAHLLGIHYYETRSEYCRHLEMANRHGGDVILFLRYALQGFVDGLRDQINLVRDQQFHVAWVDFVFDRLRTAGGTASVIKRRRELVLEMSTSACTQSLTLEQLSMLTPHLAKLYGDRSQKTLRRDINELQNLDLVIVDGAGRFQAKSCSSIFIEPSCRLYSELLPAKCLGVATVFRYLGSSPCNPRTNATPMRAISQGSSVNDSSYRPHRGSRSMLMTGAQ